MGGNHTHPMCISTSHQYVFELDHKAGIYKPIGKCQLKYPTEEIQTSDIENVINGANKIVEPLKLIFYLLLSILTAIGGIACFLTLLIIQNVYIQDSFTGIWLLRTAISGAPLFLIFWPFSAICLFASYNSRLIKYSKELTDYLNEKNKKYNNYGMIWEIIYIPGDNGSQSGPISYIRIRTDDRIMKQFARKIVNELIQQSNVDLE